MGRPQVAEAPSVGWGPRAGLPPQTGRVVGTALWASLRGAERQLRTRSRQTQAPEPASRPSTHTAQLSCFIGTKCWKETGRSPWAAGLEAPTPAWGRGTMRPKSVCNRGRPGCLAGPPENPGPASAPACPSTHQPPRRAPSQREATNRPLGRRDIRAGADEERGYGQMGAGRG